MSRKRLAGALVLALATTTLGSSAHAAEEGASLLQRAWPHEGVFGAFDRAAAQRGFQVYREICAGCHGLQYMAFRNLLDLGFEEDEVRALASEYSVTDGPDEEGEMFERPAKLSDPWPSPYPNDNAARAANGGALPPELSLITKARFDGSNYLYSLLVGYEEPPADAEGPEGTYYNAFFPGHWIAMPQPLDDDYVEYTDGTQASLEQTASDVSTFLTWIAEPTLETRKRTGLKVVLFLIVLTALLYATKRKIWADVH